MRALQLPSSVRVLLMAALTILLSLSMGVGQADAKKKKKALPSVTKIAPLKVSIGDTIVIKGKNFRAGTGKNTVVFRKASGGKYVFAKTLTATTKRIVLKVPPTVLAELNLNAAKAPEATRFQLRVVSARATGGFSALSKSPTILPTPRGSANADCDSDGKFDDVDADDDNDGLSDAIELQYGLKVCGADTDGDGVTDGFEFESALDFNSRALPFPGKRPWPNPLDPKDLNLDFDGDGLTLTQEFLLWDHSGRPFPLNYSDGDQYTGGKVEVSTPSPLDLDRVVNGVFVNGSMVYPPNDPITGVGYLSDDEKDLDNDGLSNRQEFSDEATPEWWVRHYPGEPPYLLQGDRHQLGYQEVTSPVLLPWDADTDGDGVTDGNDDEDGDGWRNIQEMSRYRTDVNGGNGYMVNPFNPCLPDYYSRSCSRYIPATGAWAPFNLDPRPSWPIGWDDEGKPVDSPTPGVNPNP